MADAVDLGDLSNSCPDQREFGGIVRGQLDREGTGDRKKIIKLMEGSTID